MNRMSKVNRIPTMDHRSKGIRRALSAVALVFALAPSLQAQAGPTQSKEAFTHERFAELQAQGALILVDVFADWCPTCAIQQTVLAEYREQHPGVPLHTLTVDFDTQKDLVTHFRAPRQSTLILYRGTDQVWFSVAETRPEVIAQALNESAGQR